MMVVGNSIFKKKVVKDLCYVYVPKLIKIEQDWGERASKERVFRSKEITFNPIFPVAVTSQTVSGRADVPFLSFKWIFLLQLRNGRPQLEAQ